MVDSSQSVLDVDGKGSDNERHDSVKIRDLLSWDKSREKQQAY